ncbi:hypothetical protein CSW00_28095 [Pseudomonas asiatica]|nr:hypothetical protein CSW00_28095 [Pseudomonas sp. MR 02]
MCCLGVGYDDSALECHGQGGETFGHLFIEVTSLFGWIAVIGVDRCRIVMSEPVGQDGFGYALSR